MMFRISAVAVAAALACACAAHASTLVIQVDNVRNARGRVHVDVCPEAQFLGDDCPYAAESPARTGTTMVMVRDLPPGRYAVQAFHDENGNGKADRGLFGIPKEGIGFSNDAPIRLSPPKFADARFDFTHDGQHIRFRMRYFTGPAAPAGRR